jgi:hypothetical protein
VTARDARPAADERREGGQRQASTDAQRPPGLRNWPVQLHLLHPRAPYFEGASLLVAADCAAFAHPSFHHELAGDRVVAIGCPKLDDAQAYVGKIADILRHNRIKDITVALMEVPCCGGLGRIVQLAQASAGTSVPVRTVTVTRDGRLVG